MSIRATVRMTGAAKNTVTKLLVDLGDAAAPTRTARCVDLPCRTIQCDEMWAFCYAKQKNVPEEHKGTSGYGDVWTWVAICADTKLVPSWLVGERTRRGWLRFMRDLQGPAQRTECSSRPTAARRTAAAIGFASGRHRLGEDAQDLWPGPSGSAATARRSAPARHDVARRPGPGEDQHELRRAPEPHDADGDAPLHAADQRVLQEGREPRAAVACTSSTTTSRARTRRSRPIPAHARDGGWQAPITSGPFTEIAGLLD